MGAFFALSGYVTAYTSTEVGERAASPKLTDTPAQKWWLQKVMSYYPMHWLVLLLFSPMFVYSDVSYGGWAAAAINGVLAATLTQAWAPADNPHPKAAPDKFPCQCTTNKARAADNHYIGFWCL